MVCLFPEEERAGRVVLVDRSRLGQGASSRAAGIVRSQGGRPAPFAWPNGRGASTGRQHDEIGIDSGFVRQGYFIPAFSETDEAAARARLAMQQGLGLGVRWSSRTEADALNPTMAPGSTLGGTFFAETATSIRPAT